MNISSVPMTADLQDEDETKLEQVQTQLLHISPDGVRAWNELVCYAGFQWLRS